MPRRRLAAACAALLLAAAACRKDPAEDEAAVQQALKEKGTLEVLDEVAAAKYTPPEDGKLTAQQIEMYLAVRQRGKRIREVAGKELEKKSAEAKKEGEEMGLFEAVQAVGDAADIATANLRAAQELKHNPKEYQWVEERVTEALLAELSQRLNAQLAEGRDEYVQLLEAQKQAVADPARRAELERKIEEMRGRAEQPAEPPGEALRHNVALVARYRDRIRAVQTPEERFATGHGEELPGEPPTSAAPREP
jgi:hypothetical protein